MGLSTQRRRQARKALRDKQGDWCCYCKCELWIPGAEPMRDTAKRLGISKARLQDRRITVEHLHALKDGGSNCLDNLALCCDSCNQERGRTDMSWLEFATYKEEIGVFRQAAE